MKKYQILWTDMHSNPHHEQIGELSEWLKQARELFDFWPLAYYPYHICQHESGLAVEDRYPLAILEKDWEYIRSVTEAANQAGFAMFMGYEWQGNGQDGDHNVFFKDNQAKMAYPLSYRELRDIYKGQEVIAIPHHLAYQPGERGKNWATHDETFSPFAEVYSSHGSSENDHGPLAMNRHIHMGPRTAVTTIEAGYRQGYRFGLIASGDNHQCPGIYCNGYCAVLAENNTKEAIWEAFKNRRVYGVSGEKIAVDFTLDEQPMGSIVTGNKAAKLALSVKAADALDRIEILSDNKRCEMIAPNDLAANENPTGTVRFKFRLELGWGPDRRIFPQIKAKIWQGKLETSGKLLSIEKCWSNFGQELNKVTAGSCEFKVTSFKKVSGDKWMGNTEIANEGFIFEIEADYDSMIALTIDGINYYLKVRELFKGSRIIPLMAEAKALLKKEYGFTDFYRNDPWWHNAYKIKIYEAVRESAYTTKIERIVDTTALKQVRVRIWQRNGSCAWSSPIFIAPKDE